MIQAQMILEVSLEYQEKKENWFYLKSNDNVSNSLEAEEDTTDRRN